MRTRRCGEGHGRGTRWACLIAAVAGLACGGAWTAAGAQPDAAVAADRGFGGVELPVDLVVGELELVGRRAWVWRVPEPVGPETIRVLLDGEIETTVGPNRLHARRVSLWLHPVGVGGVGDASGVYEVFGFYEDVESPGGPAAFGFSADELPVQALIATTRPVRLSVDLRISGRPEAGSEAAEFDERARAAFAEALEVVRDPEGARRRAEAEREAPLPPPAWLLDRRRQPRPAETIEAPGEGETGATGAGVETETPALPEGVGPERRAEGGGRTIPFSTDRRAGAGETGRAVEPPPPPPTGDGRVAGGDEPGDQRDRQAVDESRAGPGGVATDQQTGPTAGDAIGEPAGPADDVAAADGGVIAEPSPAEDAPAEDAAAQEAPDRIFSSTGVFFLQAGDRVVVERGEDSNALTLTGGVVVQHEGPDRTIEMTAGRAVVFLEPGPLGESFGAFGVSDVLGVYLEGGVRVSDGSYTLRSPRVYYDVQQDRAVLVDAVFRTYDDKRSMPLYMRADVVRQEASNRFSAEKAVYANTAFATPHLAVGTSSMTIEQRDDGVDESYYVDAQGITLRGGGVPFFYFPRYRGDPERFPLRSIGIEDSNRTGPVVRTTWDPFALLGIEPPKGTDVGVDIDYYTDRGLGLGVGADWGGEESEGELLAGILPDDDGTDVLRNRTEFDRDDDTRAFAAFRHRWRFRPEWVVQLDGFHASDEKVLPALYRDIGVDSDELTTRGYLRRQEDDTALTLELKGLTTDFLPNEHAAQSPGYAVDKLPELGFTRIGDDVLEEWATGALTHTWSAEYAQMRLRFQEITPTDVGLARDRRAQRVFGVDADQPIAERFRSAGLDESLVNRFDTRHEFSTALNLGPLHVTPFGVGRFTAYDTDFSGYSPEEEDNARVWGAAGVTLSTSIYRVDDAVESRVFDLHRMRHIIEPSVTLWHADSTVSSEDIPVYDDDVEGLLEGSSVRVGLNQTWQTKRGAPGRWRTVDVFTLDAEYVWFSDEAGEDTPIGRYYAARPELSSPDEFVRVSGTWQVTEVVGLSAETVWDVEDEREDRNAAGVLIRHSDRLSSNFQVRQIESQNDTYGDAGLDGMFGDKYYYSFRGTYNFRQDDFQAINFTLLRQFPNGLVGGEISYNNISGETSFGVVIQPTGATRGSIGGRNRSGFGG